MLKSFFLHNLKRYYRSPQWEKKFLLRLLLLFCILVFSAQLLILGYFFDEIILTLFPESDVLQKFSGLLFYYLFIDLFLRFLFQKLPAITIIPYLNLPVKRHKIFNFLLLKSAFSFFNILPLLVIIPFLLKIVIPEKSFLFGITWGFAVTLLIFSNNYINFYLKKFFTIKPILVFIIFIPIAAALYFDQQGLLPLSDFIGSVFLKFSAFSVFILLPLTFLCLSYQLSFNLLKRNTYLEGLNETEKTFTTTIGASYFQKYGKTGELILLEIKMILRNSKPRNFLLFNLILFLSVSRHYFEEEYAYNFVFFIPVGILLTGIFTFFYGRAMLAWEGSYFDFLLTKNITPKEFFTSKYWLFSIANAIAYTLTLPLAFFNHQIILINFSLLLYNSGINTFIVMLLANMNREKIDLKGSMFNNQGINVSQNLLMLILSLGIPLFIYFLFNLFNNSIGGFYCIGAIGVLGIIFKNKLLEIVIDQFNLRKHLIVSGFRNS